MSLAADTPRAGDNSGDPFASTRADIEQRIGEFLKGADIWEGRAELDKELADRANDFISGARSLWKEADEARKAEGRPHRDAEKAVNESWTPLLSRIEKIVAIVKPKADAWLKAETERKRKAEAEAREKQRAAEEAARAAAADAAKAETASERIIAEERAEAAAREAEIAERAAAANAGPARIGSATGLARTRSLKTKRTPVIKSMALVLTHYRAEPELIELIERFAARDLRAAPTVRGQKRIPAIPGIEWIETQELA